MRITLVNLMKLGGISNILLSPLWAYFYQLIEPFEHRGIPDDPFWLYSFYFCTFIFGFLYYKIATNPEKFIDFFVVAIMAKTWGIFALIYTLTHYHWIALASLYDLFFLVVFILLYSQTKQQRITNG